MLSRNHDGRDRTHWLDERGQPACWNAHQECAEHKVDELTAANTALSERLAAVTAALAWYADEVNYDQDDYQHEDVPGEMVDSDTRCSRCGVHGCREYFKPDRGERARAALAAGQPAPAAAEEA